MFWDNSKNSWCWNSFSQVGNLFYPWVDQRLRQKTKISENALDRHLTINEEAESHSGFSRKTTTLFESFQFYRAALSPHLFVRENVEIDISLCIDQKILGNVRVELFRDSPFAFAIFLATEISKKNNSWQPRLFDTL